MVWTALLFFLGGTLYQIITFYSLSRPRTRQAAPRRNPLPAQKKESFPFDRTCLRYRISKFRLTVFGRHPAMMIVTLIFHLTLVITPFFVLGHNILMDLSLDFSLPSLPERVTDLLAVVVLACCLFFMARRLLDPAVRAITTTSDYLMLAITAVPFLTGFLAYHHVGNYETMVLVHMAAGEVMIMVIPFTRFVHMIYFFINRFVLIQQNTLGKGGSRVWR
jgi:nitrate reductase gamma subunit